MLETGPLASTLLSRSSQPFPLGLPFLHSDTEEDSHWPDSCFSSLSLEHEARLITPASEVESDSEKDGE